MAAVALFTWFAPATQLVWGPDNPLPYYLLFAIQLPASLLFSPIFEHVRGILASDVSSHEVAYALVMLAQFVLLAVAFRRPWRSQVRT